MSFKNATIFQFLLLAIGLIIGFEATAQQQTPMDIALRHLESNAEKWGLSADDISDIGLSDLYVTKHNGVTHVFLNQQYQGIEVHHAIVNIAVTPQGKTYTTGHRFVKDLASKVVAPAANIEPAEAVMGAAKHLGVSIKGSLEVMESSREDLYLFEPGDFAKQTIRVKKMYFPHEDGRIYPVWNVLFDVAKSNDYWDLQIRATDGVVLDKLNYSVECRFHENAYHNHDAACRDINAQKAARQSVDIEEALTQINSAVGSYRVFALPDESPNHGSHQLVVDPAQPVGSPYGWHDTDGVDGAEYTITRGNNTHSYLDWDDIDASSNDEPDGGAGLVFDFPYVDNVEPDSNRHAAVINLFYCVNTVHDFTYRYGFDEAAGNFQQNNYGNGGIGGDPLQAEAQDGFNIGNTNNANYSGGPDGTTARIQMFAWSSDFGSKLLHVNAPSSIKGSYETGITNGWGLQITETDTVRGEVVIVNDGTAAPYITDGCEDLDNASELDNKIALIDRGGCEFGFKALQVQEAGAVGVIICNFEDATIFMGAGAVGGQVTIPVLSISSIDCATIRQFAGTGLDVTFKVLPTVGPDFLDGDFDNGIIAHEYGHGVSARLIGGPSVSSCVFSGETASEGISDLMTLITTVKPGDTGDMRRGVGTFAIGEEVDGRGIRRFPYSTDMNINPLTYGDLATSNGVHAMGEVWTTVMWDLHWAFVEEYGFDADLINGNGGNNTFVQLMMDGMKLSPCEPGYLDLRDAVLKADTINNNAENSCMIWGVFARRGMGYFADQGTTESSTDQLENFDSFPLCVPELKISKTVTPLINAGDDIDVTLNVLNHKPDAATNVIVTDELPNGVSYVAGSVSGGYTATVNGSMLSIEIGEMASLAEIELTYKLSSDDNRFSIQRWFDPVNDNSKWFARPITSPDPGNNWEFNGVDSYSGDNSWAVPFIEETSVQQLITIDPISINGANPVIRFFHRYDSRPGTDGGIIEVTKDDDPLSGTWERVDDQFIRNGYPIPISYFTFVIPNISAFSGNSGDWAATYLDLSDYAGESVFLRFNFAIDGDVAFDGSTHQGWFVDDIELMNLVSYNGEVCVTSDEGDMACAIAKERGTIVESQIGTAVNDPVDKSVEMNIFPNPADDQLTVYIASDVQKDAELSLMSLDGRELMSKAIVLTEFAKAHQLNLSQIAGGFYFVKVTTAQGVRVEKVVVR